jgi:hypothetical protein
MHLTDRHAATRGGGIGRGAPNNAYVAREAALDEHGEQGSCVVRCFAPPPERPTIRDWSNAIRAVKAAINFHHQNTEIEPINLCRFGIGDNDGEYTVLADAVLTHLLESAYRVGTGAEPDDEAYLSLGLLHTDAETTGSFFTKAHASDIKHAAFKIIRPPVNARSIVIVVTVGGVKVTITIVW